MVPQAQHCPRATSAPQAHVSGSLDLSLTLGCTWDPLVATPHPHPHL